MDLAVAMASHAVHNSNRPMTHRSHAGTVGQADGPPRRHQAPPNTHSAVASHQARLGAPPAHPAHSAAAQAQPSNKPSQTDAAPAPLSRPHSQPAAPINSSVNTANGHAAVANRAGTSKASKTMAVITRCLSMFRLR